jgi:hypothetical protein
MGYRKIVLISPREMLTTEAEMEWTYSGTSKVAYTHICCFLDVSSKYD